MFFLQGALRDLQFFIDDLGALIGVHLHHSRVRKDEAQLKAFEEASHSMLAIDFVDLYLAVLKFADSFVHVKEHASFYYPNGLSDQGGQDAGFNAGTCDCVHFFNSLALQEVLFGLIAG